jgi:hypothetical protein
MSGAGEARENKYQYDARINAADVTEKRITFSALRFIDVGPSCK